jgi:cytosine/adenosine deaminase-related metal-dependent hydrolase
MNYSLIESICRTFAGWRFRECVVLSVLLVSGLPNRLLAADLLIHNVTVIDSESAPRLTQDVLLRDGTITAVSGHGEHPADVAVLDGTDRFLIPGLWDMHVHLSYDPRLAARMGDLFLDYGITSVRDTGGQLDVLLPIVDDLRSRGSAAPRVFYAGPLLDGSPVVYDGNGVPSLGQRNLRPEDAPATIERLLSAGVSFIKIYEMVTPDVFQALADAAARSALPIAAHVPLSMLASQAAPAVQ